MQLVNTFMTVKEIHVAEYNKFKNLIFIELYFRFGSMAQSVSTISECYDPGVSHQ